MSNTESKTCLRIRVDSWERKSWDEVYSIVEPLFENDDPMTIDRWDNEVEYFSYQNHRFHNDNGVWYVDNIFEEDTKSGTGEIDFCESLEEIAKSAHELLDFLGLKDTMKVNDVRLVSVSWYNGCEEPVNY